jgi:hypothetical protein
VADLRIADRESLIEIFDQIGAKRLANSNFCRPSVAQALYFFKLIQNFRILRIQF